MFVSTVNLFNYIVCINTIITMYSVQFGYSACSQNNATHIHGQYVQYHVQCVVWLYCMQSEQCHTHTRTILSIPCIVCSLVILHVARTMPNTYTDNTINTMYSVQLYCMQPEQCQTHTRTILSIPCIVCSYTACSQNNATHIHRQYVQYHVQCVVILHVARAMPHTYTDNTFSTMYSVQLQCMQSEQCQTHTRTIRSVPCIVCSYTACSQNNAKHIHGQYVHYHVQCVVIVHVVRTMPNTYTDNTFSTMYSVQL